MSGTPHNINSDLDFSRKTMATLIDVLPGFVYRSLYDCNWTIQFVSNQCYEITGYTPEELINNTLISFNDIIHPEYREYLYDRWGALLKVDGSLKEEYRIIRKDGKVVWIQQYGHGVFDENNKLICLDGYITDITARKEAEDKMVQKNMELYVSKERAEENDKLKTAFISNLSHEIRTPMNVILGFAEMLKDSGTLPVERNNYIDIINQSGLHLLSIINDIIEISKIESRKVSPNYEGVDINLLMDVVVNTMSTSITPGKKLKLRYLKPKEHLRDIISTDPAKLRQIIENLISNSIKFTNVGYVDFWYDIDRSGEGKIVFYVKDTGIGIKNTSPENVFEKYRKVLYKDNSGSEGSGLGLAISKAYVEMLGGEINVESEYGKGSLFRFSIPMIICKKCDESTSETPVIKGEPMLTPLRILVAEDEDTNFLYISALLTKYNHSVYRASNGKEAVDIVKENDDLDLVLMDIKMPILNGYDALKLIKKLKPYLPVVAQTAYALSDDEQNIRAAGFDGYIAKPIMKNQLVNIIDSIHKH